MTNVKTTLNRKTLKIHNFFRVLMNAITGQFGYLDAYEYEWKNHCKT